MNPKYRALLACLAMSGLFFLLGVVFIPLAGVQYDEALFIMTYLAPEGIEYNAVVGGTKIPMMLMTYLGTLKAAILKPVFDVMGYNHRSLRLPPLAFASLSVALFFLVLRRLTSLPIAFYATLLLATDAAYLLTSVYDWGPVALQHLFLGVVLYSGVRYAESRSALWLIPAGLAAGLALWDKAISIWIFAGGGVALLAVFPREMWSLLKRPAHIAALSLPLLAGAYPLIHYNIEKPLATITKNTGAADQAMISKIASFDGALDGRGLFGYVVRDVPDPEGKTGAFRLDERATLWLSAKLGAPRRSLQHLLLIGAVLLLPLMFWSPWRRAAVFTALALMLSWAAMLLTKGAGGSLHHTILLSPLPHLLAGLVLAEVVRRFPSRGMKIGFAVFAAAVLTNLFVVNQYRAQLLAYGPTMIWTSASRPLVEFLGTQHGRIVFPADWGIQQQIDFYGGGVLGMTRNCEDTPVRLSEEEPRKFMLWALSVPEHIYVTHTEANEAFKGSRKSLIDFAASQGLSDHIITVIRDRHQAPMFEVHEFRK